MNRDMVSKLISKNLYLHDCNRCQYSWVSSIIPKTCAKCRSPYWANDRVRKITKKAIRRTRD